MPDPVEPEALDLDVHAGATASLLGLSIDPSWRSAVVANLTVLRAAARLVEGFPLPDEAEAAPVYAA